jgi:hypothetical protein
LNVLSVEAPISPLGGGVRIGHKIMFRKTHERFSGVKVA